MAGWAGVEDFKKKAGGKGEVVPCMYKMFGIEGCPHCEKAKGLFDAKKDDEAKKAYFKRQLFGFVFMIDCEEKAKQGKILLKQFPTRVVDTVLAKVQETDPDTAWPTPTDLATGRMLVLSKDKGKDDYPVYAIDIIGDRQVPLTQDWWDSTKGSLPRVDDNLQLLRAVKFYDPSFMFSPTNDMKEGTKVKFRMLPVPFAESSVPFGCLTVHYVAAPSAWDKAWADVKYDPAKLADVQRVLGITGGFDGGMPVPGEEFGGPAGAPGVPGAPGRPW